MWRSVTFAGVIIALGAARLGAQEHEHEHDQTGSHEVHSHRGPGPHFIDAFWVENAYLERKLRPDVLFARGDEADRYTARLEVEWAVLPRVSLIAHVPAHHLAPVAGDAETGFGDVTLGPKLALINDRRRLILAVGGDFLVPTGDEDRGLGEGHAAVAPFALAWLPFGPARRFLLQGAAHVELPLESEGENHLELGTALSWTSALGISPLLEAVAEVPLEGAEDASWAIAPGFRWEFAPAWEVGGSARIPVAGPREADVELIVGLIRHFPLPR